MNEEPCYKCFIWKARNNRVKALIKEYKWDDLEIYKHCPDCGMLIEKELEDKNNENTSY